MYPKGVAEDQAFQSRTNDLIVTEHDEQHHQQGYDHTHEFQPEREPACPTVKQCIEAGVDVRQWLEPTTQQECCVCYKHTERTKAKGADVPELLLLYVAVLYVVGTDGAEALQGGSDNRDAGRATDALHPFHLTDTPLEDAAEESQLILCFADRCRSEWLKACNDFIVNLSLTWM